MMTENNDFCCDFKDFVRLMLSASEQNKIEALLRQEMYCFVEELNKNGFEVYPRWDKENREWIEKYLNKNSYEELSLYYEGILVDYLHAYKSNPLDEIDEECIINYLYQHNKSISEADTIWKTYLSITNLHYERINDIKENVYRKVLQEIIKNPIYTPSIDRRNRTAFIGKQFLNAWTEQNAIDNHAFFYLYDSLKETLTSICKWLNLYYRVYEFNDKEIILFRSLENHAVKVIGILD